jgi:hypothetical protein
VDNLDGNAAVHCLMAWSGGAGKNCVEQLEKFLMEDEEQKQLVELTVALNTVAQGFREVVITEALLIMMASQISMTIPPDKHSVVITSMAQALRKMVAQAKGFQLQ